MMDVARLDKQKSQLWWTVTILMIMCMYWLSNVVLWVPWSHNPQLGILLMLTVNPLFWAAGIYICLASVNRTGNLMKKALVVASLAVGISLIFDYLFFAVYMGSKDVWHITTFYGYAWLAVLTFGEVLLLKKKLLTRQYAVTTRLLLILTLCLLFLLFFLFYYLM